MGNTTNYGWEIPDNGADTDTWGTIQTTLYQAIDTAMFAATLKNGTRPFTGKQTFLTSAAGGSGYASFNVPPGAAPTTNLATGDVWATASALFYRLSGSTVTLATLEGSAFTGPVSCASTLTLAGNPTTALEAATKGYVDSFTSGLQPKTACGVATTANVTLSGEQTIDGVTTSASRILVKDQTAPAENGIYTTGAGAWSRVTDMDAWSEVPGALAYVSAGSVNAGRRYYCTSTAGGTLNTTAITFILYDSTTLYTGSGGITLTGADFALTTMAAATVKGRASGAGTGAPTDLTGTQLAVIVDAMVGDSGSGGTKGLVPAPSAGAAKKVLTGAATFTGFACAGGGYGTSTGSAMSFGTDAQNIASFTKSSTGKWILTVATAFTDATSWTAIITPIYDSTNVVTVNETSTVTTRTAQVAGYQFRNTGNALADPDGVNIILFGY
jgi:hypothetical protein